MPELPIGVPLKVITSALNDGVIPVGSPEEVPIPVAPVVAIVISVIAVFKHTVGEEDGVPDVLSAVTVIVPVAFTLPQPPVNGMM